MKKWLTLLCALALGVPAIAHAWWNADWTARRKITLDTGAQGLALTGDVASVPVLVRLHTGNFPFAEAQLDGNDLRFIAEDDKTPLRFHVEKFDGANELALVWVQVPKLAGGNAAGHVWLYYGNDKAPVASDPKGTYDASQTAVLHFAEADGQFRDATAHGHAVTAAGVKASGAGLSDGAAAFDGQGRLTLPAAPALKLSATGGLTWSAWIKPAAPTQSAVLFEQEEGGRALRVVYENGQVFANGFGTATAKVDVPPGAWHHVGIAFSDRLVLYVDGREVASAAVKVAELGGNVVVGAGYQGEMDEVQLASVARPAGWFLVAAAQGEGGKLVKVSAESEGGDGEGASYFRILLSAVTLDGWVVIGILMVMMVISFGVMIGKGVFLARTDRANKAFQQRFAGLDDLLAEQEAPKAERSASLLRMHATAVNELRKRAAGGPGAALPAKAITAIRASLDAVVVRENARLNSQMVLLTIAISGGPFLGLLGTVVGVMITFAAIAAAGDVNVNSIAPGIAAALVATVAGLGVAIPALFGYNYLAGRIKTIAADMNVFADELTARIAERYGD